MHAVLDTVIDLAEDAGKAILEIYNQASPVDVSKKSDDSPLTAADLAADKVLKQGLAGLLDGVPVLSEEGASVPYAVRSGWSRYWLIDPLDGTKEFISRNGEFTVNVALIENGRPVLGVVHVPVSGLTYCGAQNLGATKLQNGLSQPIQTRSLNADQQELAVVASRRHGAEALTRLLANLAQKFSKVETQNIGSSLKLCLVAEGAADLYPRLAPTCEWDTAAAQAVVEAAGGAVLSACDLVGLKYNSKESLLNPYFYVVGDKAYNWNSLLPLVNSAVEL